MKSAMACLLVCTALFFPACSMADPSDEDKILEAIASLSKENREKLRLLQRRLDGCQILSLKISERQEDLYFTCYQDKGSTEINFGPNVAHDLCSTWDGSGRLRDHMQSVTKDFVKKNTGVQFDTCIPSPASEEVLAEVEAEYPDTNSLTRIVEMLLLGAIPAAMLVVVAPELLPILCLLGRDAYCADNGALLPPGPVPVDPTIPSDTDSP
jgi:hypothetical protein